MKRILLCSIFFCLILVASASAKDKISFSGWGAAGYMIIDRNPLTDANQPTYYLGKLQADIEINDEIEAQLDLRGNSVTNNITFREFSAKFNYMEYLRFKMGNIKRPFGQEYIENREDLPTINRSVVQANLALMGYSRRSVSIMAYYNYSKKRPEFPYTYAITLYKDNSQGSGAGLRGLYHHDDFSIGLNYVYQSIGGNYPVSAHGFEIEARNKWKKTDLSAAVVYARDPARSREILATTDAGSQTDLTPEYDAQIYSFGSVLTGTYEFKTDAKVIKEIEPVALFGFFIPNSKAMSEHTIQCLAGVNFYFTKKVRVRLNADLRLSKSKFEDSGKYATNDSSGILELQVRF